jgi:hypothetical protein
MSATDTTSITITVISEIERLSELIEALQVLHKVHGDMRLASWSESAIGQNLTIEVQRLVAEESGTFEVPSNESEGEAVIVFGGPP